MTNKTVVVFSIIGIILIAGIWITIGSRLASTEGSAPAASSENVTTESGKQVITILAKGGYTPRQTSARAGVDSIIRVYTDNSYDCSVALTVPKIKFQTFLKPKEVVDIPVSANQARGTLRGICSMGMYSFDVRFL